MQNATVGFAESVRGGGGGISVFACLGNKTFSGRIVDYWFHRGIPFRLFKGRRRVSKQAPPKSLFSSRSRRWKTAKRTDQDLRDLVGINTLRISFKKEKQRFHFQNKWTGYLSGSKTLVNRFISGKLTFDSKIRESLGDKTKWILDSDFVFDSPEMDGGSDTEQGLHAPRQGASPVKNNVYALSPGSSVRRSPRLAARVASQSPLALDLGEPATRTSSPIRRPSISSARNPPRAARPINFSSLDDSIAEEQDESGDEDNVPPVSTRLVRLENDPYDGIDPDEIGDEIYTFYPQHRNEGRTAVVRKLEKEFNFERKTCMICKKKIGSDFVRCVGIMAGNQCLRNAHYKCNGGDLLVCSEDGCESAVDKDKTIKLIYLYFHAKSDGFINSDTLNDEMKAYRQSALAKSTAALIRTFSMRF